MKKNDKLVVVVGVIILIIASIGIYFWAPSLEGTENVLQASDLSIISGDLSHMPNALMVSDCDPFYALVATPLAVNYDKDGKQNIVPLYVVNFDEPSRSIMRAVDQIGVTPDEIITDSQPASELSLKLAEKYWDSSNGVILIKNDQSGYNLGVLATPLASYLRIPVVVADKIDEKIMKILQDLGVKYSIVCGNLTGYGKVLKFENADDVVDATIEVVREKFGDVNYITVTNPIDTYTPEILEDKRMYTFSQTVSSGSFLPSQLKSAIKNIGALLGGGIKIGSFEIPDSYKYALVKFYGAVEYNSPENPDEFGSSVSFNVNGPEDTLFGSGLSTNAGGVSVRDPNGNIIKDQVYSENVLYARGGTEYSVNAKPMLFATTSCKVDVVITIEKLNDSLYPMMKGLSSIAPYLASYHKGIVFGKPEFAFVADDTTRTALGETCPGPYQPRLNPPLIYPSNQHVMKIHEQINELLAKLANIDINDIDALKYLREYYTNSPVYITLVGDTVVLPQIIYDNAFSEEGTWIALHYGMGIPTDVIYGNIDPVENDFSSQPQDMYTRFPEQENIIGRVVGWDVQDTSALIAREIFYEDIIDDLGDWKKKATVHTGCGTDFLEPPLASFLNKYLKKSEEPVKWPSGCTNLGGDRIAYKVLEPLGFEVSRLKNTYSGRVGFSDDAINKIKNANLLSRLLFSPRLVKLFLGEQHVKGAETLEESNFIWQNGHGMPHLYDLGDIGVGPLGWRFFPLALQYLARTTPLPIQTGLSGLGSYTSRGVEYLNLGPSVTIVESCFTGKIDGLYPKTSVCLAHLHAGAATYIASTTETNVPGGYLEPYYKWDRYNIIGKIVTYKNIKKGIYPEPYFGQLIESDFYENLGKDQDVGTALRNARNVYLDKDWDNTFVWVPPLESENGALSGQVLIKTASGGTNAPDNKYMSYLGYQLYGDPAFNPYVPNEE